MDFGALKSHFTDFKIQALKELQKYISRIHIFFI